MTDVFLYSGESNPNDVKLRDPTTPASGGGDVTLALTGVSVSCLVGALAVSIAVGLSGISRTGSTGTLAHATTVPLTKVSATGGTGFVTVPSGAALTGVSATGGRGSVSSSRTIFLSGVSATGAVGSVAAPRTLAISGNEALGEAGDLAVDRTSEITGVGAAGSIGTRRYLLGEDGNKLRLEDGSGFLLVEAGLTASGGQDVIDVVSGGGYGLRRIYHRTNRVISQREMVVAEIIYAVAKQQIDHPSISESARLEQLSSVMAARGVEVESLHAESLAAERNRLISMEVARLLKIRADQEDEALLMILAEAV